MDLPRWFKNRLHKVMEHNDYTDDMLTTEVCNKKDRWTPCDLICREFYNNGCGSAKGFLGLTPAQCKEAFGFIREHQNELREMDYYNKDGFNNWGFKLWENYDLQ